MVGHTTGLEEWVCVDTQMGLFYFPNREEGITQEDIDLFDNKEIVPPSLKKWAGSSYRIDSIELTEGYGWLPDSGTGCDEWEIYHTEEEMDKAISLSVDSEKTTFKVRVYETRTYLYEYVVLAKNIEEAEELAERGETESEDELKLEGVEQREVIEVIDVDND